MKKFIFMGALALLALGSCNSKTSDNHDGHDHGHDHGAETENHSKEGGNAEGEKKSDPDEIVLPPEKAAAAGVVVKTVEPTTFEQVIRTSGQVLTAQGDESVAVASVAGVVSFRGQITEGMSIQKGSALVTLSSKNMAEGDPVQRARIAYNISKKEYERMKALLQDQIVSNKEFAVAEQNYENARLSYEALGGNQSVGGQTVTAPIGGYIKSILVKEGDYVSIGQPLVSVTQNRRLFLRAEVAEKYYSALQTIGSANFLTPHDNKVYALRELNGRLLSFGKSTGTGSFYIPVTFEFDNRGDIIPGSFVEIFLLSKPMEQTIALPRTALTEEQGNFFVYLQLDEEGYKRQEVKLGADNGVNVQILSGVKAGDRVVTEGAYQVRLASTSNTIPGHSH